MGMFITVTGVYNHYPNLFELLQLPDGVNPETARDNILFQCGEMELLYSDPVFLRGMIGNWCKRRAYKWETLQATTVLDYNPIENYDRKEDWSDEETGTSEAGGNTSTSGNNTEKRKGFEGGDLVETAGASDSSSAQTSSTGSSSRTSTRRGRAHGNIGVTTSQQMIMSERDVADFSLYDVIAQDFAREFCLYVY